MKTHINSSPAASVAKITPASQLGNRAGSTVPNTLNNAVQWGEANGCTFRFDPQALPRHPSKTTTTLASRRSLLLQARQAAAARAANRPRGGRSNATTLAAEAGFDYDYEDENEIDNASISSASPHQGGSTRGQAAQGEQAQQNDQGTDGGDEQKNSARKAAAFESVSSAPLKDRTLPLFNSDPNTSPMLLALAIELTSDKSSRPLRQRALTTISAITTVPAVSSTNALGHVRAALIDAVNSGAIVPRVNVNSPDQNCLLPILLLRALRPMPAALRKQAASSASAMLSMTERSRATRANISAKAAR
jgi:hypothetical protein